MAAICLGLIVTSARAGTNNFLVEPASPTNPASAMWTLENIYNVLDTRTTNVTKRTDGFTEPTAGPTNGTMHTLDEIMTLVTNRAPVPKTGQTASSVPYDDAWYRTNNGVAWSIPRFTTNGVAAASNCVTDHLTGLMWLKNPDATARNWTNAIAYCEGLDGADGRGGYTDWRLPNMRELQSIISWGAQNPPLPAGHPFIGVLSGNGSRYWTSTSNCNTPNTDSFNLYMDFGGCYGSAKASTWYVWPVRGGGQ